MDPLILILKWCVSWRSLEGPAVILQFTYKANYLLYIFTPKVNYRSPFHLQQYLVMFMMVQRLPRPQLPAGA